ncbi:MAG: hypothetical protein IPJ62_03455 [Betaproteobacteria bacterium]|nr:hypothetical protein [Betaproteobacteria bacterium]
MKSQQTDFPAIEFLRIVDRPATIFARSGLPGRFPEERAAHANVADEKSSTNPYGRRVNDIGQERRRCIEFS